MSEHRLSRHAKNNLRLYKIERAEVDAAIERPDKVDSEDVYTVYLKKFAGRFDDVPLKVVANDADNVVVSAYPLIRRKWRHKG